MHILQHNMKIHYSTVNKYIYKGLKLREVRLSSRYKYLVSLSPTGFNLFHLYHTQRMKHAWVLKPCVLRAFSNTAIKVQFFPLPYSCYKPRQHVQTYFSYFFPTNTCCLYCLPVVAAGFNPGDQFASKLKQKRAGQVCWLFPEQCYRVECVHKLRWYTTPNIQSSEVHWFIGSWHT